MFFKVAVRMRPLNKRESNPRFRKAGANARAWHVLDEYSSVTQISNTGNPLAERVEGKTFFTFDKAFGEQSETKDVYEYAVRDLVDGVISGRNGSCFAYGQVSVKYIMTNLASLQRSKKSVCFLLQYRQVVARRILCKEEGV